MRPGLDLYRNIRIADPFLKPYWRHERVIRMLASVPPERCKRHDDKWVQTYKKFLFLWNKSEANRDKLMYENPGLYFAFLLHDRMYVEPETRLMIEARILAGYTSEEIARECKTIPETIEWYEKLFFNVKDFLVHHDWILKHVLLPASDRFVSDEEEDDDDKEEFKPRTVAEIVKPHFDMTLKFFAYYGGPIVCDLMISGFRRDRKVITHDDLPDYFHDQFMTQIMKRSAEASGRFEVNKYNVMELFNTHSRIIEIQKSTGQQENKYNEIEKHVNSMMSEFMWTVGNTGKQLYDGTLIGQADELAAEVDSDELLKIGAGEGKTIVDSITDLNITGRKEPGKNAKSK